MDLRLFFDSETTGFPKWKEPSGSEDQPHLVQIAGKLVDIDKRETLDQMNEIIRPQGWIIPQETIDVHGISMDRADSEGIPEAEAIERFIALWEGRPRVSHNTSFDNRIIRIGTKRYCDEDTINDWKSGDYECTGLLSKPIMQLKKMPKLTEAYQFFTGQELVQTHDAMDDVEACIAVYFGIMDYRERQAV